MNLFDRIAPVYDFFSKYILKDYEMSFSLIERYLKLENEEIIDIGGGTGFIAKKLAQRGCRAALIEPSHEMISKIKDDEILAIRGDAANIPIKRGTFDAALLINTLHHIEKIDHGMVLSEIFRILKYGGKLLVIEVFPHSLLDKIFVKIENMAVGKTYHVPPHQLKLRLNEIGFHIEGTFFPKDYYDWGYVILAKK